MADSRSGSTPESPVGVIHFAGADKISTSRPLSILMLAPQPFFRPRGTPFSVLHRIRGVVSGGHSVDLLTYPFGEDVPVSGLNVIRCRRPLFLRDVKVGPSVAKLALDFSMYGRARSLLRNGMYDVIHSHEEASFFGVGLARRHGLTHVYDMHSSLPQQLGNFAAYDRKPFRAAFRRLERYVLAKSNAVITVCPELEELVDGLRIDILHAMIENTGDDTKVFGVDNKNMKEYWNLSGKKVVLYTGTLENYQGVDLLLSALPELSRRIPLTHVLIVGGRSEQIAEYRKQAKKLGVESAVTFTGTQPPDDMPAYAASADVIVSPRCSGTNTPGKLYGYLRTGRPLVATDLLTHTQVLDSDIAELVPASPRGLLEGLYRVLSDPAYSDRLGRAARERADQMYSDDIYLQRVRNFYEKVAACVRNRGARAASMP